MDFELKPISHQGVAEALEKVERYRLLNEPSLAESICLDVLHVEPGNQRALVMLLLSLTDQFGKGVAPERAREILPKLKNDYERAYYEGIIHERQAYALLRQGSPESQGAFRKAMASYDQAEHLRPTRNDDAILRWNTCARALMRNANLTPSH
jgi:uncharacterized protein YeeX (DUF496 family)